MKSVREVQGRGALFPRLAAACVAVLLVGSAVTRSLAYGGAVYCDGTRPENKKSCLDTFSPCIGLVGPDQCPAKASCDNPQKDLPELVSKACRSNGDPDNDTCDNAGTAICNVKVACELKVETNGDQVCESIAGCSYTVTNVVDYIRPCQTKVDGGIEDGSESP